MQAKIKIGVVLLLTVTVLSVTTFVRAQITSSPATKSKPDNNKADPLKTTLVRSKVATIDGKEVLQNAEVAKPGDILEDVVTYLNTTKLPLKGVEATLPVPPYTELVLTSVRPSSAKASLDGVNFAPIPLKRRVRQSNGVEVEQNVPLSEYKYLRWSAVDLPAEKSLVVSARFRLATATSATPSR